MQSIERSQNETAKTLKRKDRPQKETQQVQKARYESEIPRAYCRNQQGYR